jgi:hypothetical protein
MVPAELRAEIPGLKETVEKMEEEQKIACWEGFQQGRAEELRRLEVEHAEGKGDVDQEQIPEEGEDQDRSRSQAQTQDQNQDQAQDQVQDDVESK